MPRGKKTPLPTPLRRTAKGGLLRTGNPGNKGGSGTPPSLLREQLRGSFAERIKTLESFADGTAVQKLKSPDGTELQTEISADISDRIKAIDMLAKYGLGTLKEVSVENVRERVQATLTVIRQHTSPDQAITIINALRPLWA